ncbi:hypothetical protein GmRootV213_14720 [Variovorax sp. V213]
MQQGAAGLGGAYALRVPREQRAAKGVFHAAHALAGRGERHVRALCAGGQAPGLHDVEEEPQVCEIESHDEAAR